MRELSAKQRAAFESLRRAWRRHGAQPSLRLLATELGIGYVTLRQHLRALETKGYLRFRSQGRGRAPILQLRERSGIPLVGDIAAGPLSEAIAHPEGYLSLPGDDDRFGLRVSGDSMADAIQDGDVVILQRQRRPKRGEVCAVRVNGSEVTLKYLEIHRSTALLRAHNPNYPPLEVPLSQIHIDGVFVALLRGEVIAKLFEETGV